MNYNKNQVINQEIFQNREKFIQFNEMKVENQANFLKKQIFVSSKDIYISKYDFYKSTSQYYIDSLQKVFTVEQQSRELNYDCSLFGTITLPSRFHPYTTYKTNSRRRNSKYKYNNISDSIREGNEFLQIIWEDFYKRVKNFTLTDLKYIKVTEPHKSHIPHTHFIFYTKLEHKDIIIKLFEKVCKKYNIKQKELKEDIKNSSSYIRKYLIKNFNYKTDNDRNFMRYLDGWKKKHKINIVTSSNVGMSKFVYKKLYYSMTPEEKQIIIDKKGSDSFMKYFIDNSIIETETIDMITGEFSYKKTIGKGSNIYNIEIVRRKFTKLKDTEIDYKTRNNLIKTESYEILEELENNEMIKEYKYSLEYLKITNNLTKEIKYDRYEDGYIMKSIKQYQQENELLYAS